MANVPLNRRSLRLSWSEALWGAELYDGEDVGTFATDWHFHEGWQLVAVTRGKRHYEFKSGSIVAQPGKLVLVPPRLVHRAHCSHGDNTSFRIATLPAVCLKVGTPTAVALPTSKLFGSFLSVFESLRVDGDRAPNAVLTDLQTILSGISLGNPLRVSSAPAFVLQMESYLLKSLEKIPSLGSLSARAGVSRYHLTHAFTKHIGLSPLAFHARARLMQSRKLIAEGWSLAETSLSLNFSDQSHFGRQFKRVYGMTPGEYQQSLEAA